MLRLTLAVVCAGQEDERGIEARGAAQIREQMRRVHFQASKTLIAQDTGPERGLFAVRRVHNRYRSRLGSLGSGRLPSRSTPGWLKRNSKSDSPRI